MNTPRIREATTINEMRAEIDRLRREVPVVRSAMHVADLQGLSGEDRYTLLAYQVLVTAIQYEKALMDRINLSPMALPVLPTVTT